MPVFLTVIFGLILNVGLYYYFLSTDQERVTQRLQRGTGALILAITSPFPGTDGYFGTIFSIMDDLRNDLPPGTEVDQTFLDEHFWETPPPGFETATLEYLPRVAFSERGELAPRFGEKLPADFRIRVKTDDGSQPAPQSNEYFPVMFEASGDMETDSIGVDRGANPLIRTLLHQARDTGELVTYGFYPLAGAGDQTMATRFFSAIYDSGTVPGTVGERRNQLSGFVSLSTYMDITSVADLIPESYQGMEGAFMPLEHYDPQSREPEIQAGLENGAILETVYQLPQENNADWLALTRATPELIDSLVTPTRWWVVSIGVLFTLWAASMMLRSRNYSLRVTDLVRQRTRELADRTEALSRSEELYHSTVELAAIGIAHVDREGNFIHVNPRLCDMLGYSPEELLNRSVKAISHAEDADITSENRARLHKGEIEHYRMEKRYLHKSGKIVWVSLSIASKKDSEGNVLYEIAAIEDVTARVNAEQEVRYLATHDEMTHLPNRAFFMTFLQQAVETGKRYQRQFAVMFIDLDGFKQINDTLGHEAGDILLMEMARRYKNSVRSSDLVARLGGDEFVVLVQEISHKSQVALVAGNILSATIDPVSIKGQDCRVTASLGICMFPEEADDGPSLMRNADMAMYLAKESGKNSFRFYSGPDV